MTAEPPEVGPAKDKPSAAERPPETEEGGSSASRARRIAVIGGIVVGAVVVAILLMNSDDNNPALGDGAGPEQGVACPFLQDAFEEFEAGNDAAFAEAVRVAAREAELTLERSGQVFGRPEALALELRALMSGPADAPTERSRELLVQVEQACMTLDLWPDEVPSGTSAS